MELIWVYSCLFFYLARLSLCCALGELSAEKLLQSAHSISPWLIEQRRHFHKLPEIKYEEVQTSEHLLARINEILFNSQTEDHVLLYAKVTTGWGQLITSDPPKGTGLVVDIGTGTSPTVAVRADIDALPIDEQNLELEYRSQIPHRMHACGHDGHMTMLLGALKLLAPHRAQLPGTVRFIFQPAEEGGMGALRMLEEGVLSTEPEVKAIFGLHVDPTLPYGVLGGKSGVVYAAGARFEITVRGKGGHAAFPHMATDPILAGSRIVELLYSSVNREFIGLTDQRHGIVTVASFQGGDAFNVIPPEAKMTGTIRSLHKDGLLKLKERITQISNQAAQLNGCIAVVSFDSESFPPVYNSVFLWETFTKKTAALASRWGTVEPRSPVFGGEDFAFFSEKVPAGFLSLGINSGEFDDNEPRNFVTLHSPSFNLDERALPYGAAFHAIMAVEYLKQYGTRASCKADPVWSV